MSTNPASPELIDFLQQAGIRSDHPIVAYFVHIGLTSETSFVEFKPGTAELVAWCDKFKTEVKFGAKKIGPIEGDHLDALKASLVAAHEAISKNNHPTPASPTTAIIPTPASTSSKDQDDKIPKTLPPGVCNELIEQYNKVTIHGQRRVFPEKQLLGAEKIIARMWYEHNKSKCYTGMTLGGHQMGLDTDPHWRRTGHQPHIQRFEQLIRRHADRIPQVKEAWNTFSWQLAMQMRSGVTFKQASTDILRFYKTPSNSPTFSPNQSPRSSGASGAPKAKARANTSQTDSHSDHYDSHAGTTASHTTHLHPPNRRMFNGNHHHSGTNLHSRHSGNRTYHLHLSGHRIPDQHTQLLQ